MNVANFAKDHSTIDISNAWNGHNNGVKSKHEQRTEAEEHYYQHGRCISRTIQALGYPSRALLKQWLSEDHPEDFQHCSADKPRVYLTQEQKVEAVQDLCTRTGSARSVADKYGVSPCSLYIMKMPEYRSENHLRMHMKAMDIGDFMCVSGNLTGAVIRAGGVGPRKCPHPPY